MAKATSSSNLQLSWKLTIHIATDKSSPISIMLLLLVYTSCDYDKSYSELSRNRLQAG